MSELQRQAYLQAMGVDAYFPHVQLPAAAVSELYIDTQPVAVSDVIDRLTHDESLVASVTPSDVVVEASTGPDTAQARSGPSAAIDMLLGGDERQAVQQDKIESAPRSTGAPQPAPIFNFCVSVIGPFLLIDEQKSAAPPSRAYSTLVFNLATALNIEAPTPHHELFSWPMVQSAHVDQSELVAKKTLDNFLMSLMTKHKPRQLILAGATVAGYCTVSNSDDTENYSSGALQTASLTAALSEPMLKADIWRDLSVLRV